MVVIIGLLLVVNFFAIIVSSLLTASNCKPGTSRHGLRMNPFNLVLMPELLTETGKIFRKITLYLCLLYIVLFISAIVLTRAGF